MFRIVLLCTGNRNRSPLAEALLRKETEGLPIDVSSAGLLDLGAAPPLAETLMVANELGIDISRHRARFVKSLDLRLPDLLLGLEWEHVAAAVVEESVPADRAFTLLELVSLLRETRGTPPADVEERARYWVGLAHDQRRSVSNAQVGGSIRDPFGGPIEGYFKMASTVQAAVKELTQKLFGD